MRASLRKRYRSRLAGKARAWQPDELRASAIVIAPHQDDETLACGATVAAKTAAGASVRIVFMTDGTAAPAKHLSVDQLRTLRRQEALAAAEVLGVPAGNVHFLDFPKGQLGDCRQAAVPVLRQFLVDHPAEQVFVPYRGDALPDQVTTRRVFYEAVGPIERHFQVFEYPVWFWSCWPWARRAERGLPRLLAQARDATRWTWAIRFQLRAYAMPPEAQAIKRRALEKHQSPAGRRNSEAGRAALADAGNGDFLSCFDQSFEVFYRKFI